MLLYQILANLTIYYTWKNIKKSHKNNKWNKELELPDRSYSISNIQD